MFKKLLYTACALAFVFSCREDDDVVDTPPVAVDSTITVDLSGYVQKGPFINGTAITVSELDKKLVTTGKNFTTQIADNKGSFSLKGIKLKSNYVQLQADGFYFDEVKGEKSAAQLTLFALSNVEDASSINANLLSHMERTRVIYLMQEEEKSFAEAKTQAQKEILTIFGIEKEEMQNSELLDISQDGEDNAILLAISSVLQANNSVAELSELVANLITDLREDGVLSSQSNKDKIREQGKVLNLSQIRTHLEKRYEELGVNATIPNFEQYIDSDGDGILNKDEDDNPDDFTFALQKDVAINTKVTSNAVKISGLKEGGSSIATVQGGAILLNGNVAADSVTQVKNGDQLQLELTSGSAYVDTVKAIVSIGTLVKHFQVITDDYVPDAFSFMAQKDVAVDSVYTSNVITVSGIPYATPLKIEGGVLIKNGEALITDTTSVKNGDKLAVKLLSSSGFASATSATVDINRVSASFSITTDDYVPDAFSFTPIENAKRDSVYTSNTIEISGLPYSTPVSVNQGFLVINGQEVSTPALVSNGDQIVINFTSSKEYETKVETVIKIGRVSKPFSITTTANPWQRKADFPANKPTYTKFSIGEKIYAGGYEQAYGEYNYDLYEYNPSIDNWSVVGELPFRTSIEHYSTVVDKKAYCLYRSDLWEYDSNSGQWFQKTSFPNVGFEFTGAITSCNGKVYFINYVSSYTEADEIWEYSPSSNTWQKKGALPFDYSPYLTAFSLEEKIYIVLPNKVTNTTHSEVWEYNSTMNSWIQKSDLSLFSLNSSSLVTQNKGYFLPGSYEDKYAVYNQSIDQWKILDVIPGDYLEGISSYKKGYALEFNRFYEFTPPQE